MESKTGRPIGTGYTVVMVTRRPDNVGYHLSIGRRLYQDLGSPDRVNVQMVLEGYYQIIPVTNGVTGWSVLAVAGNGMPRIAIGKPTIEDELRLDIGTYPAVCNRNSIRFIS